jgi:protease secretion system membrane fusion protein
VSASRTGRLASWIGAWNPYNPNTLADKGSGLVPVVLEDAGVRRQLVVVITVAFLAFLVWSVTAPLDAGMVVEGAVAVAGSRQAVQHPSGGVVQELLVKEGATVEAGQLLVRINPLNSEANLTGVELQYINLLATESRLFAERTGTDIRWKPELAKFGDKDARVIEAKQLQSQVLHSRQSELDSQTRILREQLSGQRAQAAGMTKVMAEKRGQLKLISEEARNTQQLAKEGYVPETKANEVQRAQSSLQADLEAAASDAERLRTAMAATELQIAQLRMASHKDIDNQLSETQKTREALQSRMASLKFDLGLAEVKAPVSGTVIGLKVNTVGGVVTASQTLMEIVPKDARLIIEAQVPPASIDKMRVGLMADLRFSAFNQKTTPVIPGKVILVGADKQPAASGGGGEFYLAQVETTPEGLALLGTHKIQPGMPVEVIIKTGERSFMTYLIKPLTDRLARSFKED